MKILTIKCPMCKVAVFSRANHDFRWCACDSKKNEGGFVDGGHMDDKGIFGPFRVGGTLMSGEKKIIELDVTEKDLYDDWNLSTNKYGRVTPDGD